MAILFVTLSLFSLLIFNVYKNLLMEQVDNQLLYKAEAIADSINTYWEAERLEAIRDGRPYQIYTIRNNQNFVHIAQKWVIKRPEPGQLRDPHLPNLLVQIFDAKGRHIASSKAYEGLMHLPTNTRASIDRGNWFYNTATLKASHQPSIHMRQLTVGVEEQQHLGYIVQISCTLDRVHFEAANLQWFLLIFIPTIVLLTGIMGAFLAGRTLKPVRYMTETIQTMDPNRLSTHIPVPQTHDELQHLAETFNKLLAEASHAFIAQTQFISDASHELRTPLTIIKGELDVLLKKRRSIDEYQLALSSTLEEIDTLEHIIDSLLLLARLDNVHHEISLMSIDLTALINQILNRFERIAKEKQLTLTSTLKESCMIDGEPTYLERLFSNLIDNAIKYSSKGGTITLSAMYNRNRLHISIEDQGIGIRNHHLSQIFDRFFQADSSRHGMGFGLGLSMCKRIMELHHGKINVKSKFGEGTTFDLDFPV